MPKFNLADAQGMKELNHISLEETLGVLDNLGVDEYYLTVFETSLKGILFEKNTLREHSSKHILLPTSGLSLKELCLATSEIEIIGNLRLDDIDPEKHDPKWILFGKNPQAVDSEKAFDLEDANVVPLQDLVFSMLLQKRIFGRTPFECCDIYYPSDNIPVVVRVDLATQKITIDADISDMIDPQFVTCIDPTK